jgi:hypothetical protein
LFLLIGVCGYNSLDSGEDGAQLFQLGHIYTIESVAMQMIIKEMHPILSLAWFEVYEYRF